MPFLFSNSMHFCFLILVFLLSCTPKHDERASYSFDRITFAFQPTQVPTPFPRSFLPDEVQFQRSVDLKSGFLNSKEAYLVLISKTESNKIASDIESRSKFGDWKLLEKTEKDKTITLLLEGFLKKYISIIIFDTGETRIVKYFFKKNTGY